MNINTDLVFCPKCDKNLLLDDEEIEYIESGHYIDLTCEHCEHMFNSESLLED